MIQSRAQFGYRGVVVPLVATLFTYVGLQRRRPRPARRRARRRLRLERDRGRRARHRRRGRAGDLRPRLAAPGVPRAALRLAAADARGHGRRSCRRRRRAATARADGGFTWAAFLAQFSARRGLQHHLRAVRLGLLALPAGRTPAAQGHRGGVLRRLGLGDLADRARRLARHPARRDATGWPGCSRPATRSCRTWATLPPCCPRWRCGDDGHERLRRDADRAHRRSTPSGRSGPAARTASSPSSSSPWSGSRSARLDHERRRQRRLRPASR